MARKVKIKTKRNTASVSTHLDGIENQQLKSDCMQLHRLFEKVTGMTAEMWGGSIIGYGSYKYYRANGDEGVFMATGFAARKSGPTIYIMPGYQNYSHLLKDLGPYKLGKSCLYLKNLKGIDLEVLTTIIRQGLDDLKKSHETSY